MYSDLRIDSPALGGVAEMTKASSQVMTRDVPTLKVSVTAHPNAVPDLALEIISGFNQVVGRDSAADITVPDPTVSRRHARITHDPDGVWLEDLGSSNGTYVGGHRLVARYRLADGDQVKFGNATAVFHDVIRAPDSTKRHDVVHDVISPTDSSPRHESVIEGPAIPCPRCSAALGQEMWFCHHCGYQQWPIAIHQPEAALGAVDTIRARLIGPHGNIRCRPFRQVMRARNGGRRPRYSEGLAIPPLVFRVVLVFALVAAAVAAFVVLGLGVHHFVQLRQQPGRRMVAPHSHFSVPTRFHTKVR
jgi:hypothetical protein